MEQNNQKIEYVDVGKLRLDPNNNRFAELYSGSENEDELIEYLLYTEAAEDVASNIVRQKRFYPDEVLWVVRYGENLLVKDGNRRCAAVKALFHPEKYGLDLKKMTIEKLPVLIYEAQDELERRIQEQHTNSFFREWDRIAKALKAFEMHKTGLLEDVIREIDSNPGDLIKLASFYFEAVKIGGEDFKRLLRRGRGSTGGKTIIFERLFSFSKICGYKFMKKPSYEIEILNKGLFERYIQAIVRYLSDHPETSHKIVDNQKDFFLKQLEEYGFVLDKEKEKDENHEKKEIKYHSVKKNGSVKNRPDIERKRVDPKIKKIIDECYGLDARYFPNAKTAIARVSFETVLKFVVEETKYKKNKFKDMKCFYTAYYEKNGSKKTFTNFENMKKNFTELILDTKTKKSFEEFELGHLHQVIHNYKVGAIPADAKGVADNLIPLIEFMLQDESELLKSLDLKKCN